MFTNQLIAYSTVVLCIHFFAIVSNEKGLIICKQRANSVHREIGDLSYDINRLYDYQYRNCAKTNC